MPPSNDEFAAWLNVEIWLSLAIFTLAGVAFTLDALGYAFWENPGSLNAALPYILGGWFLVVGLFIWYARR